MKHVKRLYLILIIIFMYAPIVTLMVLSFNASGMRSTWGGFTLDWYVSLFQNEDIMTALYTTLIIALISAAVATVIGVTGAIGINALRSRPRSAMMTITNIPMLNADIVTGISLMLFFIACRFTLGFSTVLIAHITFNIPFVILSVLPRLRSTSVSCYEAALDLGATRTQAFFKVTFPDILPGVVAGFLLAFTMSLDDFIITHFTKGPEIDTLSTKIYAEVRKGIKPEIYALSTLVFVVILVLLILINVSPEKPAKRGRRRSPATTKRSRRTRFFVGRIVPLILVAVITLGGVYYSSYGSFSSDNKLIVYNWGEYLDPDLIDRFQQETGIEVIYEEFDTNETMYPKIASGSVAYDLVCPSDYMIQRMIEEGLLAKINYDNIPNMQYLDPDYLEQSRGFDPTLEYSVPYLWGTVGILYNKKMVNEPVTSWQILWDEKYADSILMQDSVRDAFAVPLKMQGYSLNSTDLDELTEATELLKLQKPLVQAYVIDQVRDKMVSCEAALGVIYSGEAMLCLTANEDLAYVVPEEGSNLWIDSWVIPANAQHKENAEKFLNFLCDPEVSYKNFEYTGYSVPNAATRDMIYETGEIPYFEVAFPTAEDIEKCETYSYLGPEYDRIYNDLWKTVKSE